MEARNKEGLPLDMVVLHAGYLHNSKKVRGVVRSRLGG